MTSVSSSRYIRRTLGSSIPDDNTRWCFSFLLLGLFSLATGWEYNFTRTNKSGGFGNEWLHLASDAFTPLHYADVNAGIAGSNDFRHSEVKLPKRIYSPKCGYIVSVIPFQFCMPNIYLFRSLIRSTLKLETSISKKKPNKYLNYFHRRLIDLFKFHFSISIKGTLCTEK